MRHVAAIALVALFSAVLLVGFDTEAEAQTVGASGEPVVNEARGWIGTPFYFGGAADASAAGVDCSGLTMLVMSQFGVSLPDSPAAQFGYGVPSDGKAGDLVFFDEHGSGINLVGIATGNGTVIHASEYTGTVTETPIEYLNGYVGARDVL